MLASERKVRDLTTALEEQLHQSDRDAPVEAAPLLDLNDELPVNLDDWTEGVEEYKTLTDDSAWEMLGLPEKTFPLFNATQDLSGGRDPWVDRDREWFTLPQNGDRLVPRWHQVIGVTKMIDNFFADKPTLLMDDVGLGKTLQVTGFFATLAFYRDHHEKNGCFPGRFSMSFPTIVFLSLIIILENRGATHEN